MRVCVYEKVLYKRTVCVCMWVCVCVWVVVCVYVYVSVCFRA